MTFHYTKHYLKNLAERICDKEFNKKVKNEIEQKFQKKEYTEIPNGYSEKYKNETFRAVMLIDKKYITTKFAKSGNDIILITIWSSKEWEIKVYRRGEK